MQASITLWRKYGDVPGVITSASPGSRSGAKAGVQEFWVPAFVGMREPVAPMKQPVTLIRNRI